MPKIVAVHGIAQQLKGEDVLHAKWLPALRSGLRRAAAELPNDQDLACAFYGHLFRAPGKADDYAWEADDVKTEWELDFLRAIWEEAARIEPNVPPPDKTGKMGAPQFVQNALSALTYSKFFVGLFERAMIGHLKQVYRYLHEEDIRAEAQKEVARWVGPDTRVLIGHSLGSVVAYEVLCAHPEWQVHTFVTLGSPLGIRNLVFHRLRPQPAHGKGAWPGSIVRWVNIADRHDVVALTKVLAPMFQGRIEDHEVDNQAKAHKVEPYLTAALTGQAIAAGLAD